MAGSAQQRKKNLTVLAAVLVVVLGVLGIYLLARGPAADEAANTSQHQSEQQQNPDSEQEKARKQLEGLARRAPEDPFAIGRPDAPVVLINYSDYRCSYCAKFALDIQPTLVDKYVKSGVLRIEWRDMPIFGDDSINAAKAGRAAGEQGKFWQFHEAVVTEQPEEGHPPLPVPKLLKFAEKAGVPDMAKFKADMDDPKSFEDVRTDASEAHQIGISSTPTFLINGQGVSGAQPTELFEQAIEQAQKQAR